MLISSIDGKMLEDNLTKDEIIKRVFILNLSKFVKHQIKLLSKFFVTEFSDKTYLRKINIHQLLFLLLFHMIYLSML